VHFGRDALAAAMASLGDGYTLLTTPRARGAAPALMDRAGAVHDVPAGRVDELAGALLEDVEAGPRSLIVALGGGRVIDTAKAIAAARAPGSRPRVAAVPTTLSAAEMTAVHRRAAGADGSLPGVRPAIVVNDPALSASQPAVELAASAANALAHAAEGPATRFASPVPALAGGEAARLIGAAYAGLGDDDDAGDPDRDMLALAALLSGYTIDSAGYGLHHVMSQTLARFAGVGHGPSNAAMLPHTLVALERRGAPGAGELVALATDLARRARSSRLRDHGVDEAALDTCADRAAERAELDHTPPRADRHELRAIYAAAF
jgi:alcohol dehydrogenase class IV